MVLGPSWQLGAASTEVGEGQRGIIERFPIMRVYRNGILGFAGLVYGSVWVASVASWGAYCQQIIVLCNCSSLSSTLTFCQ